MLPEPAMLVVAVFSRYDEALAWSRHRLSTEFGPIALAGEPFAFTQTDYYQGTMGPNLQKQLLAFEELVPPDHLANIKLRTNDLEKEFAASAEFPEDRPLNLDPGILTLGKFMLATTKNQAHRIYLSQGIYAEVTLRFQAKSFAPWPWTYADYREPYVIGFLNEVREYYRRKIRPRG
ncbi:MAG: GTP-binding protein [Gemmatales bacterium]|nr:MAG: GTP-binding protein [Gemmatales bacterium]